MAVAVWSGSTAFSVGDIRRASDSQPSGLFFRCTTAGNSASAEPNWPNNVGDTVTDGTCVWTGIASAFEELAKINPSAIIELFELRLDSALHGSNDIYRWHAGTNADVTGNIVFGGQTYERIPVKADGFEYTNTGTLPRPTLTVSNLGSEITSILLVVNQTTRGNDLGGAEVRRIRTLKKYLDGESAADPNVQFPQERWFIDRKASETRDSVSFELASKFDLAGQKIPRRQVVANVCQWKYRSSECSYTGSNYFDVNGNSVSTLAEDVCGKRIASCKLRFGNNGQLPFGSFPGAGLTQ
jgi:lambda family phage minor tail protein L|tara:strand:+ start:514 stop:1407 length:894 start_codon:yes stop_codon:yes gene_type:complete